MHRFFFLINYKIEKKINNIRFKKTKKKSLSNKWSVIKLNLFTHQIIFTAVINQNGSLQNSFEFLFVVEGARGYFIIFILFLVFLPIIFLNNVG